MLCRLCGGWRTVFRSQFSLFYHLGSKDRTPVRLVSKYSYVLILDAGPKLLLASRRDCGGFSTVSGASNPLLGDVLCSEINGS